MFLAQVFSGDPKYRHLHNLLKNTYWHGCILSVQCIGEYTLAQL